MAFTLKTLVNAVAASIGAAPTPAPPPKFPSIPPHKVRAYDDGVHGGRERDFHGREITHHRKSAAAHSDDGLVNDFVITTGPGALDVQIAWFKVARPAPSNPEGPVFSRTTHEFDPFVFDRFAPAYCGGE